MLFNLNLALSSLINLIYILGFYNNYYYHNYNHHHNHDHRHAIITAVIIIIFIVLWYKFSLHCNLISNSQCIKSIWIRLKALMSIYC